MVHTILESYCRLQIWNELGQGLAQLKKKGFKGDGILGRQQVIDKMEIQKEWAGLLELSKMGCEMNSHLLGNAYIGGPGRDVVLRLKMS